MRACDMDRVKGLPLFADAAVDTFRVATAGAHLVVRRTAVAELVAGVEAAHANGEITDDDRRALLTSIDQRHPNRPD